jgi:hypothetical protein
VTHWPALINRPLLKDTSHALGDSDSEAKNPVCPLRSGHPVVSWHSEGRHISNKQGKVVGAAQTGTKNGGVGPLRMML